MKKLILVPLLLFTLWGRGQNADSLEAVKINTEALQLYNQGQIDESIQVFEELERLGKEKNLDKFYIVALLSQSNLLIRRERFPEAREKTLFFLKEAESLIEPDDVNFLNIYNNLAIILSSTLEKDKRDFYLTEAKKWLSEYGDNPEIKIIHSNFLVNIGSMLLDEGDYEEAIVYEQRALDEINDLIGKIPFYSRLAASAWEKIGSGHTGLEEYDEAIANFQQSLDIINDYKVPGQSFINRIKRGKAFALYKMNKIEEALDICLETLKNQDEYRYEQQKKLDEHRVLHIAGQCYTAQDSFTKAETTLKKAIELRKEYYLTYHGVSRHGEIGNSLFRLAELYRVSGKSKLALLTTQEALIEYCHTFSDKNVENNPLLDELLSTYYYLPKILQQKAELQLAYAIEVGTPDDLKLSLDTYKLLVQLVDRDRKRYLAKKSKLFLLSQAKPAFEGAIGTALSLYDQTGSEQYANLAFEYAEKSKSVLLYEALKGFGARYAGIVPDSVLLQEKTYQQQLETTIGKIHQQAHRTQLNDSLLLLYKKEAFTLKNKIDDLQTLMGERYPDYLALKNGSEELNLKQVQKKLSSTKSQLVEFFVGEKEVFVFNIRPSDFSYHRFPIIQNFQDKLDNILLSLQGKEEPDAEVFSINNSFLYELMLAPLKLNDGPEKLIIIPDGEIGYLPFEILPLDNAPVYLLENYAISYAYSSNLLFNDPIKNFRSRKAEKKWVGFAPTYENEEYLEFNQEEVLKIQPLFSGTNLLGPKAKKSAFFDQSSDYSMIHLAMHGYIDPEESMFSYLSFSADGLEEESRKLYAYQIYNLELNADLLVLSACKTGYGPLAKGEGIMSLARAFRYAGCPSVLMSLWESDGSVSKDLMHRFYENIAEGFTKDEALRQAKINYLKTATPNRRSPRYWANFVLIGEADPLESDNPYLAWIILVLVLLFGGVGFFYHKNQKSD